MKRRLSYAIRHALYEKGMKPPDLARALKVDASTTNRWAKGTSVPDLLMLKPLAKALGVEPKYLYDPQPVPEYGFSEYLVREATGEGVEEGIQKHRRDRGVGGSDG
jgi:transcriptional regulator with XRE-family HTH domain